MMRYVTIGMFTVLATVAATFGQDPTAPVAAGEGPCDRLPILRSLRPRLVGLPLVLQDKKDDKKKDEKTTPNPPTITFPGTTDSDKKAKLTFFASGAADSNYVFGVIYDPTNDNWLWPGTTVSSDWHILFDSIPPEMDGRDDLVLRVE